MNVVEPLHASLNQPLTSLIESFPKNMIAHSHEISLRRFDHRAGGDCWPNFARYVHFVHRFTLQQIHFIEKEKKWRRGHSRQVNYHVWLQSSQSSHDYRWMGLSQRICLKDTLQWILLNFSDHPAGGECCPNSFREIWPICMQQFRADSFYGTE